MKLKQLKIQNFRCYHEEMSVDFDNLTAIIGKNDAGKSTILEALEIFFNNETVSIDREDLNKHALAAEDCLVSITCVFDEVNRDIILDANVPTSLASEYLLNSVGCLEIKKAFKCDVNKIAKPQVFIVAHHPSRELYHDLHQLKITALRTRANDLGVNADQYNGTISSSLRKAIWNHAPDLQLVDTKLSVDKEDTKKIWEVLERWMPMFALFQSDRKSRDDDREVTDPMKVAVNEALENVAEQLAAVQESVRQQAIEVANRTLAKLQEMNPELANQLIPDFKTEPSWNSIFKLTLSSDLNIPVNKRGSGVRRLILLNFFRAEADKRRLQANNPNIIYAFEEPETSQHPDHQRLLVDAFLELAETNNTQVLLTTHTPALAGLLRTEQLRLVGRNIAGVISVRKGVDDVYKEIASTLGVLPDPLASKVQLLIGVEGPNDINFIRHANVLVRQIDNTIIDLSNDERVIIYPLGGSVLKNWVTADYLKKLNKIEFHIYDRDDANNPPYQQAVDAIVNRGAPNHAVLTVKRTMENYIHPNAIQRIMQVAIAMPADFDDVPAIVAEAVHNNALGANAWNLVDAQTRKHKANSAKKRLNDAVMSNMTVDELQQVDPHQEITQWFRMITQRLN
jgi:predicted ATPase